MVRSVVKFLPLGAYKPAGKPGKMLHRGRNSICHLITGWGSAKREADCPMASEVCAGLGSGASLCGAALSFLLLHFVERADGWARRGMQLGVG